MVWGAIAYNTRSLLVFICDTMTAQRDNEEADFLTKPTAEKGMSRTGSLTLSELSSRKQIDLTHLGRAPPDHPWYFGGNPGDPFKLTPRKYHIAFLR
ncbi:hypothetical protein TNCV_1323441 [Trichonephila clavipes]|nr:hypothetical protein TNCV_1323441 [Trichonephila clavipes]